MKSDTLHLLFTSSRLQKHRGEVEEVVGLQTGRQQTGGWFCEALPLQSFGQGFLQVCGGCWEGELDCDAAAIVEDGGQVVSFGGGQDGQLVVGLTCSRHTETP